MLFVICTSPFAASVVFVVARFIATATMDNAAACSSALGLVFAATLAMEALDVSAASSTPLFVASALMLLVAANGVRFVVAARLLRSTSVCRASHRPLALARTVPAPATLHREMLKPRSHRSSRNPQHLKSRRLRRRFTSPGR